LESGVHSLLSKFADDTKLVDIREIAGSGSAEGYKVDSRVWLTQL